MENLYNKNLKFKLLKSKNNNEIKDLIETAK